MGDTERKVAYTLRQEGEGYLLLGYQSEKEEHQVATKQSLVWDSQDQGMVMENMKTHPHWGAIAQDQWLVPMMLQTQCLGEKSGSMMEIEQESQQLVRYELSKLDEERVQLQAVNGSQPHQQYWHPESTCDQWPAVLPENESHQADSHSS